MMHLLGFFVVFVFFVAFVVETGDEPGTSC
jgi:hypothetical protein